MNMFVPQSEATVAECAILASVENQLISSQNSSAMMGIIQDSLLGIGKFTRDDVMIPRKIAAELLLWAGKFEEIDLGSKEMWSSREITSAMLPQVNMTKFSLAKNTEYESEENKNLIIDAGNHISGIIDKATVGTGAKDGLIATIKRSFGAIQAAEFISRVQEVAAHYLLYRSFSISLYDMIITKESKEKIRVKISEAFNEVHTLVEKIDSGRFVTPIDMTTKEYFEFQAKLILDAVLDDAGKIAFKELDNPDNSFASMINIGSNGKKNNAYQVSGFIGQLTIAQKRPPPTYGGRTLPFFTKNELNPAATGFVVHSFIDGMAMHEAFFNAQAGREGVTDTAISTADSGYLARRMATMCHRSYIAYDYSVRNGREIVQPIMPFDPMFQVTQKVEHVRMSMKRFTEVYKWSKGLKGSKLLDKEFQKIVRDRERIHDKYEHDTINDKFMFPFNIRQIILGSMNDEKTMKRIPLKESDAETVIEKVYSLIETLPRAFTNDNVADADIPKRIKNACEMSRILIRSSLASKRVIVEYKLSKKGLNNVCREIYLQFTRAIMNPNEMVGYIAAQSISQIGTQLTIDSFHSAGLAKGGKKNRTQSFPRFNELSNARKNNAKPVTEIYLPPEKRYKREHAVSLKNTIEHVSLREFVQKVMVIYDPNPLEPLTYDKNMVSEYFKFTPKEKQRVPANTSAFVIRIVLSRTKVYQKQIDLVDFKLKIEEFDISTYVITSDLNDDNLVLRVHIDLDRIEYTPEFELNAIQRVKEILIHDLYVRGVQGIYNIKVSDNFVEYVEDGEIKSRKEFFLEADGEALEGLTSLHEGIIDKKRLYTTNVHKIYKAYGIEAARYALIREIMEVLIVSTEINPMHVELLSDIMCYGGFIMPLNRHGFKKRNPGAFARMSFEQNTKQIVEAAMTSEGDDLDHSIMGSLILGQEIPTGTGKYLEILMDQNKLGVSDDILEKIF